MLAKTHCEENTCEKFKQKLAVYASTFQEKSRAIRVHHKRACGTVTLGDAVTIPPSDLHHVLDSEAMLAISHAIEDIAAETRQGEFIATFQDFKNFLPQKQRYVSLAEDLDAVRVWGAGEIPKKCGKIDFVASDEAKMKKYWLVLFDSDEARAVLVCKQMNRTTTFADKKFIGFYSFNPYLVQSIRWRFNLLSCGLPKIISYWEKNLTIPDLKMRDLEIYLKQTD